MCPFSHLSIPLLIAGSCSLGSPLTLLHQILFTKKTTSVLHTTPRAGSLLVYKSFSLFYFWTVRKLSYLPEVLLNWGRILGFTPQVTSLRLNEQPPSDHPGTNTTETPGSHTEIDSGASSISLINKVSCFLFLFLLSILNTKGYVTCGNDAGWGNPGILSYNLKVLLNSRGYIINQSLPSSSLIVYL